MGGKETTTTSATFGPFAEQSRQQLFDFANLGLQNPQAVFGDLGGATPLQRQATNQLSQFLGQESPELQTFNLAAGPLQGILSGQENVLGAITPVFQRNLAEAQAQLGAQAPGRFSSAFLQQGTDIAGRALQDFNLLGSQLAQQQQQNQLQAALTLGQLGQVAGQAPFQRALQAGQFGSQVGQLGVQNQLAAQQMLLNVLSQLGAPTGQRQVQRGGSGLGGLIGGTLGLFGGPFLGAAGAAAGESLFG